MDLSDINFTVKGKSDWWTIHLMNIYVKDSQVEIFLVGILIQYARTCINDAILSSTNAIFNLKIYILP